MLLKPKKRKQKTCKACKQKFIPDRDFQVACSPLCAIKHAQNLKDKKRKEESKSNRAELKKFKENDRRTLKAKAQEVFNKYIRLRDGEVCISCGHNNLLGKKRQFHAGHYLTRGARPELSLNENNCHSQCSICNNYLSGNLAQYRLNLIKKIGLEAVEELESGNIVKKYTVEDYKEIIKAYKVKIKELERK